MPLSCQCIGTCLQLMSLPFHYLSFSLVIFRCSLFNTFLFSFFKEFGHKGNAPIILFSDFFVHFDTLVLVFTWLIHGIFTQGKNSLLGENILMNIAGKNDSVSDGQDSNICTDLKNPYHEEYDIDDPERIEEIIELLLSGLKDTVCMDGKVRCCFLKVKL